MAYDGTKPIITDTPAYDVAQMQANFAGIKTLVDVNHVTFDLTDQGKHHTVSIPAITPGGPIPIATQANEYALYSTTAGLFLRPPSQAAGTTTNDTNISNAYTSFTAANNGYCYMPCGIKMAWGSVSAIHNTTTTFAFSSISGFPGFSGTPFSVQITMVGTTNLDTVGSTALSSTSVGVYNSSSSTRNCYILVIGL